MNVLHPNYIQEHGHVIQKANIPFPFLLKGLLYINQNGCCYLQSSRAWGTNSQVKRGREADSIYVSVLEEK